MATKGMVIGLLGGSFDPAHEGHAHITREALKRMGLDQVWWLVTPANPLKPRQPAPMADRLARAQAVMRHPRVKITALEAVLGTRATADTIDRLRAIYPGAEAAVEGDPGILLLEPALHPCAPCTSPAELAASQRGAAIAFLTRGRVTRFVVQVGAAGD